METYIVDAFTDKPFSGNPAGVCLPDAPLSESLMLKVAQELALSETAFVVPQVDSEQRQIRFFSPKMEIPLCGHATLAAAKVLFERGAPTPVRFINVNGLELSASLVQKTIQLTFPCYRTSPADVPPLLLKALGLNRVENAEYNTETRILLLEIRDSAQLAALTPDYSALQASHDQINGVLVTAPSADAAYDFESRYFWPWSGTDEDPATGGTHTFLAPYWASRLGKNVLRSFQCSARTGAMEVEISGESLLIRANAVIVLQGQMRL